MDAAAILAALAVAIFFCQSAAIVQRDPVLEKKLSKKPKPKRPPTLIQIQSRFAGKPNASRTELAFLVGWGGCTGMLIARGRILL